MTYKRHNESREVKKTAKKFGHVEEKYYFCAAI